MSVLTATALSMALLQLFVLTRDGVEARSMRIAFLMTRPPSKTVIRQTSFGVRNTILDLRGGDDASSAAALEVEIDVDDIESSDEEEEEEEEEPKLDPKLARSAQSAVSKAKARAAKAAVNASKASVASALKSKTEKKKSNSGLFQIPYIVKACLNPFVFMQMTAGYWKSLFNYKFADTLKVSNWSFVCFPTIFNL